MEESDALCRNRGFHHVLGENRDSGGKLGVDYFPHAMRIAVMSRMSAFAIVNTILLIVSFALSVSAYDRGGDCHAFDRMAYACDHAAHSPFIRIESRYDVGGERPFFGFEEAFPACFIEISIVPDDFEAVSQRLFTFRRLNSYAKFSTSTFS